MPPKQALLILAGAIASLIGIDNSVKARAEADEVQLAQKEKEIEALKLQVAEAKSQLVDLTPDEHRVIDNAVSLAIAAIPQTPPDPVPAPIVEAAPPAEPAPAESSPPPPAESVPAESSAPLDPGDQVVS
jgi:hypothetical protein